MRNIPTLPGAEIEEAVRREIALLRSVISQSSSDTRSEGAEEGIASGSMQPVAAHVDEFELREDGTFVGHGWAVSNAGIKCIELWVDGTNVGQADQLGLVRTDVQSDYPTAPGAHEAGFRFAKDLGRRFSGEHQLTFVVYAGDGGSRSISYLAAAVPAPAPPEDTLKLHIDRPEGLGALGGIPVRRELMVSGWALARSGVASIDLEIDGKYLCSAHYGIRRWDVAEHHPGWINAQNSGFAVTLSGRSLRVGQSLVRLVLRSNSGETKAQQFWIDVAEAQNSGPLRRKISAAEVALQSEILSGLGWRPLFSLIMPLGHSEGQVAQARTSLASLLTQAYSDWNLWIVPGRPGMDAGGSGDMPRPSGEGERRPRASAGNGADGDGALQGELLAGFDEIRGRVHILYGPDAAVFAELTRGLRETSFLGVLSPGDELGCDALLQLALRTGLHRDSDFVYSDEQRVSPVNGLEEAFLKPQWSPDLLLSTNYIGRIWFAARELIGRTGASLGDLFRSGEYDLVLRLTEAAGAIHHVPEVLCRRGERRLEAEPAERLALERAARRRGIAAEVARGCVVGTYRFRRRLTKRALVSVVMPTGGKVELLSKAVSGVLDETRYGEIELILLYNTSTRAEAFPFFDKLAGDPRVRVIDSKGPFNFPRICNLGANAARGEFLLFLNDDIEVIDPAWLDALIEHAQRPEVGVVGPLLLWPDRSIQSAGVFLTPEVGREAHAFRNAAEGDPGYFGLALTQRNVIAVNGACFATRRDVFERLGGFNEAHRVVNNETDYCLKAWRAGLLLVFTPYSTLIHHERATRNSEGEDYDAALFREEWGELFADGDPYHHPHLSKEIECFTPDEERVRMVRPGRPLLRREQVRRVLLIKLDHIGDCLTAFPAIRRLKEAFPHASFCALVSSWTKPVWSLAEMVDEVIEFDLFRNRADQGMKDATEAELQDLRRRLSAYCFDLAIDLRRHPETRHILQYTGARYLAGFDLDGLFPWLDIALEFEKDPIRIRKRTHVADELLDFANTISATCEPTASPITPPQMGALPLPASLTGSLFRRPVVCVHPAAGDLLKQWPAEYFAELIDLLVVRERVNVALVGAPADKDVGRAILSSLHHPEAVFDLIGELELEELPNLLMRCALFVGNDSGPKHLAAGLGVPTVAVHSGHVDVLEWGPLGSHAVAVRRDMECSPCYYSSPKQCPRNLACLTGLRAGQVYPVCKMLLIAGFGANLSARPAAPEAIGLELGNEPSRTSEPANSTDLGDGVATSGRKSAQRLDGPA